MAPEFGLSPDTRQGAGVPELAAAAAHAGFTALGNRELRELPVQEFARRAYVSAAPYWS